MTGTINYSIMLIPSELAKAYIKQNHYSHGSHNHPSPCFGLFDVDRLIGVLMFATPCSERVRSSMYGSENVNHVIELHRLHILDITPKNTESWFISRCLKLLKQKNPMIWGVVAFSDSTEGHTGIIYRATNANFYGMTSDSWFYLDEEGRLRHPRQNGVNINLKEATNRGWTRIKRKGKHRYFWFLPNSRQHARILHDICKLEILSYPQNVTYETNR